MTLQASGQPLTDREIALTAGLQGNRLVRGSTGTINLVLPAVAASLVLPSVTIATLPAGITIGAVFAAIAWRKQVDSSAVLNALNGNQQVRVRSDAPGTFRDAITMSNNALETVASATEGGMMLFGDSDISVEVVGVDTYEFQWQLALVDGASLTLHDVQTYLILEYT